MSANARSNMQRIFVFLISSEVLIIRHSEEGTVGAEVIYRLNGKFHPAFNKVNGSPIVQLLFYLLFRVHYLLALK